MVNFPHSYLWGLQSVAWKRENIQWAQHLWVKIPLMSEENLKTEICRKAYLNTQHVNPSCRWTTEAEEQQTDATINIKLLNENSALDNKFEKQNCQNKSP